MAEGQTKQLVSTCPWVGSSSVIQPFTFKKMDAIQRETHNHVTPMNADLDELCDTGRCVHPSIQLAKKQTMNKKALQLKANHQFANR